MRLSPPPIKSQMYLDGGAMSPVWVQWLQSLYANLGGAESIIPVARGGTGIASGISGAVLGFTAAGVIASSAQLGANQIVVGGGAGVLPTTPLGLGTDTQLLHGNAAGAPSWGSVSLTADVAGILPVANGGTGIAAGTSGGVLGFTGAGTIASSAALASNALVLGGGAGATPSTPVGLGTSTTLLHGNAIGAPTWSAVSLTADVSGQLRLANGGTNANLTAANGGVVYSTATAFAINTPGSSGDWLKSSGAGAPAWTAPAALTRTNDTNVTATLGGSATTALLNAASITLGWSGQLAVARGGTALSTIAANRVPYASALDTYATSAGLTFDGTTLAVTGFSNTGNTTLGDASGDTLTVNAGTWTLGSNATMTRAIGAAAAGTTNAFEYDITLSGDVGGTSNVRGLNLTITTSGANNISSARSLLASSTHGGSGTVATLLGINSSLTLSSSGNATTGDVFRAGAPTLSSTGAFTTLTGFHALDQGHATLVTTANGFLCDDLTASATAANGFKSAVTAGTGKLSFNDSGGAGIQGAGKIVSTGATGGIGYATGAGGTQTQATSKATGVTLNTATGAITMNGAALASRAVATFTVSCTAVLASTDTAILQHESGGTVGAYTLRAGNFVAGTSFDISITNNSGGSLSEAPVIRYAIMRSVNA